MTLLLLSNTKGYTGVLNVNLVLSEIPRDPRPSPIAYIYYFCPVCLGSKLRVKPFPALQMIFTITHLGY